MKALARIAVLSLAFVVGAAQAQQILIDQPIRAGELTLFPSYQDPDVYYYVLDKARLATDENGRPQFSLLRYVQNVESGADQPDADTGDGGAILHALVTLEVTQDQLREAQRELERARSGARIEGPVVYRSGRFALISAFADEEGELTEQVLGVGNAPILDGQKAAVSLLLSRQGSRILWQSFQTATPDISFSFEMELDGYRSPQQGVIEANFDQIYEYDGFNVGLASQFLAAEIQGSFEDLTRSGAIKVTQVGDDDKVEELLDIAYRKLTEAMFEPVSTNSPSLSSLSNAAGGQQSMLDRATTMLSASRQEARSENERIRRENREAQERAERADRENEAPVAERSADEQDTERTAELAQQAEQAERRAQQLREAAERLAESDPESAAVFREAADGADSQAATLRRIASEASSSDENAEPEREEPELQDEETVPAFAIVASYQMKRVRQRGNWRIDLNKYTADSLTLRFDENIGDLRAYLDDEAHFRQVNLDDPLYRQRQIAVFLDGMNANDFGDFVNFVTVQMRKRHESGEPTYDETRIDRNNFNAEGNAFSLLYGWKGDEDRNRWLDYDYRTMWSFHGGYSVEQDWTTADFGAISVAPAIVKRQLQIEADPSVLSDANVRAVTVRIYYPLGEQARVEQVTLNTASGSPSTVVDFLAPVDSYSYEYEITWLRRGAPSLNSGRQTGSDSVLFVDEIPEA